VGAGARTLDQRIQRQHLHLVGDLLNRLGLLAGDLVDLGGQPFDQCGDVGFIFATRLSHLFACDGSRALDGHGGHPLR
jgi:hypothetical protein